MQRRGKAWTVQDHYGDWVYLTWERWRHIFHRHPTMFEFFDEILETVRLGRRSQDERDPHKYFYRLWLDTLPQGYNCITVIVVVAPLTGDRFVVTAYEAYARQR